MPPIPLASVIVNNYNYGRFLRDAIESALNQTYLNLEVIVVDDGSTDNSSAVIARYGDRIIPVEKENGGQASAINAGFEVSQGEIVIFLDADDLLLPTAVEKAVAALQEDPKAVKVHWYQWEIDERGTKTGRQEPSNYALGEGNFREEVIQKGLVSVTIAPTSANAWRRSFLEAVYPVRECGNKHCADEYLGCLAPIFGPIRLLKEPQGLYRFHGANHAGGQNQLTKMQLNFSTFAYNLKVVSEFLKRQGIDIDPQTWMGDETAYDCMEKLLAIQRDIERLIPSEKPFILVDELYLPDVFFEGRVLYRFLEKDGQYWGVPEDSTEAREELERLKSLGAAYLVFIWTTFWWLDYYPEFYQYLLSHYGCILDEKYCVIFDLSQERPITSLTTESDFRWAFRWGKAWQMQGEIEAAISGYKKAFRLQPDCLEAYLELGGLMLQQGKLENALTTYRQAVHLGPEKKNYSQALIELIETKETSSKKKANHILLYTDCAKIYGTEQVNHSLICGLHQAGYKVTCAQQQNHTHLLEARQKLGIDHLWLKADNIYLYNTNIHNNRVPNALIYPSEPASIFATARPDIIIFSGGCPLSNLAAQQVAISLGIPYIIIVHCVKSQWAEQFASYLDRLSATYEQAQAVVAVSNNNLTLLRQRFRLPENIGQVIYNGRDAQFFREPQLEVRTRIRQELGIPSDAVLLFTSARLDPEKGYQYQLRAIEQLQKSEIWSDLYFIWAGTGWWEERLKKTASLLAVNERVKFLGERSDIPDLLEAADIFILPSEVEGMPLSVMEAMAKGLPVIATAISGIPEELGTIEKLLPDPNINSEATIAELVKTIELWARDPLLRSKLGQACQRRAKKLFHAEKMIETYINLIEKIL